MERTAGPGLVTIPRVGRCTQHRRRSVKELAAACELAFIMRSGSSVTPWRVPAVLPQELPDTPRRNGRPRCFPAAFSAPPVMSAPRERRPPSRLRSPRLARRRHQPTSSLLMRLPSRNRALVDPPMPGYNFIQIRIVIIAIQRSVSVPAPPCPRAAGFPPTPRANVPATCRSRREVRAAASRSPRSTAWAAPGGDPGVR